MAVFQMYHYQILMHSLPLALAMATVLLGCCIDVIETESAIFQNEIVEI